MKIGDKNTIVIVGAGLSGAVLAERYASLGKKVIVVEKRDHIAGNCYDYIAEHGILKSKYGAHIFHTSHEDVWAYVNRFSKWTPYEHRVKSHVNGKLVSIPVNIDTYNEILETDFKTEEDVKSFIESSQYSKIKTPKNSEESALKRLGSLTIYEDMFKFYTYKQWDMYPKDLDASVMDRIPVRHDHNDRYFSDTYEALPESGYTNFVQEMLNHPNINVLIDTDFFKLDVEYEKLFYTGPIDQFFQQKFGQLQYRSIKFVDEILNVDQYQERPVINYPREHIYTRIVEHKNFNGYGDPGWTIITKEYTTWNGEGYYPVPTKKNQNIYKKYQAQAEKLESDGIYFVGRLANYKYFNMDAAIKNALDLFEKIEETK